MTERGAGTGALAHARTVADAVLYEGYLLYPYRASSSKNQSRWQFGVLGPPGAVESGHGEDATMASQFLVRSPSPADATITAHLRFLHLQKRNAQRLDPDGGFDYVAELVVGERRWLSWDEAAECEITAGPWRLGTLADGRLEPIDVSGGEDAEEVPDAFGEPAGRLLRARRNLRGELRVRADPVDGRDDLACVSLTVTNVTTEAGADHESAIAASFIGAHLLVAVEHAQVVSMTDPPGDTVAAARGCAQHRCWPVLAGPPGDASLMLVSPIILYDHPEIAEQSAGALFDSTEIDEILTLRVMTLTDEEKAAARATDPRAAQIIDRCDAMSADDLQRLHGVLRDPRALAADLAADLAPGSPGVDLTGSSGFDADVPWWDPAVDASVSPQTDEVIIDGVAVSAGSLVMVHPARRADAQDIFFAGQVARVAAVHSDVDGDTHVAVVLVDDPAADLHDWYGRYLYFAPDELEPMQADPRTPMESGYRECDYRESDNRESDNREESRS